MAMFLLDHSGCQLRRRGKPLVAEPYIEEDDERNDRYRCKVKREHPFRTEMHCFVSFLVVLLRMLAYDKRLAFCCVSYQEVFYCFTCHCCNDLLALSQCSNALRKLIRSLDELHSSDSFQIAV